MAAPIPLSASRQIIVHSAGWPVSTSRPNAPSPAMTATFPAMITHCGRSRSANTPLTRVNTSIGATCAAST